MTHYKSNLRDLEFNLFEVFNRQEIMGSGPFEDFDEDTARDILAEVNRLATGVLAESFADADRNPPVFDPKTHSVTIPESFKKSYQAYMDAEWYRLDLPPELGGSGAPRSLVWAVAEMILGANPAVHMYSAGPGFAHVLWQEGNEQQKKFAKLAIERGWGATMVLTEPDAGSDVGAGRTKAIKQPDGTWHIEGRQALHHLGRARHGREHLPPRPRPPRGPRPRHQGPVAVPRPQVPGQPDGSLGERNGVYVTNVEEKMGLKVSTTCELTFGAKHPAIGYLVGDKHDGIRQMFLIIEYARMMVGTKAIATLSTGYLNALAYAKERVQGADLTQQADKTAPRVTITHHPDVRRIADAAEVLRRGHARPGPLHRHLPGRSQIATRPRRGHPAESRHERPAAAAGQGRGSERRTRCSPESLQTLGGSGYLQDYPIEQYIRDSKIDTLYEGTTAIQGMDLFFRKIVKNNGQALGKLMGEIQEFAKSDPGNGQLKNECALLAQAAADVQAMVESMVGNAMRSMEEPREIYKVGLNTTRLLLSLGDLVLGWLLLRQAEIALARIDGADDNDRNFYLGKIAAARFFADQVLPRLSVERAIAERTTLDLMDLPEEAF